MSSKARDLMSQATGIPAVFEQAEGYPSVRVFDSPDRANAQCIGEIKSGSEGYVLQRNVSWDFHKVCHEGLVGFVGVKNVTVQDGEGTRLLNLETGREKRIKEELHELSLMKLATDGMVIMDAAAAMSNPFLFRMLLKAPDNTHYNGNTFTIEFNLPTDYPFTPPDLKFTSPIVHPDVADDGKICLRSLFTHAEWSPAYCLHKVLLSLIVFLSEPSNGAPDSRQRMSRPFKSRVIQL